MRLTGVADALLLTHGATALAPAAWVVPAGVVAAGWGLYVAGVRRVRGSGRSWSAGRTASALTGVLLVAVALSPAAEAAAGDARGHMVQHLLLGALGPLALVLGAPVTLLLSALPVPARRPVRTVLRSRALHAVSHVGTAAALSVGGLYALYLTPLYALSTRSTAVHALVHVHLLLAGCLYAWAVAGPDPAPRRPRTAVRVGAVVVAGGAHAFLAQLLYSRAPAWPPGGGHGVAEVQQAAELMYYGGHLVDLLLLTALFAAGYRRAGRTLPPAPGPGRLRGSELDAQEAPSDGTGPLESCACVVLVGCLRNPKPQVSALITKIFQAPHTAVKITSQVALAVFGRVWPLRSAFIGGPEQDAQDVPSPSCRRQGPGHRPRQCKGKSVRGWCTAVECPGLRAGRTSQASSRGGSSASAAAANLRLVSDTPGKIRSTAA